MRRELFQQKFMAAIDGNTTELAHQFRDEIIPIGNLTIEATLDIYKRDYQARLSEALGSTFETLWMILGDEDFQRLCLEYIASHPSALRNLMNYGDRMPEFLQGHRFSMEFPFLTAVAKLELAFQAVFHAPADFSSYSLPAALAPEQKVSLAPHCVLLHSPYQTLGLFNQRHQSAADFKGEIVGEEFLIIYKVKSKVRLLSLCMVHFNMLQLGQKSDMTIERLISEVQLLDQNDVAAAVSEFFPLIARESLPLKIL